MGENIPSKAIGHHEDIMRNTPAGRQKGPASKENMFYTLKYSLANMFRSLVKGGRMDIPSGAASLGKKSRKKDTLVLG